MDVTFLGTASCIPSVTRSTSCLALRRNGVVWLFDGGECSQLQLQRSQVKVGRVDRIFVTHLHGDHSFGLPGLLCMMGQNRERDAPPVEIFGPAGLRMYMRASIQLTHSRIAPPYRVHELHGVPLLMRRDQSLVRELGPAYERARRRAPPPPLLRSIRVRRARRRPRRWPARRRRAPLAWDLLEDARGATGGAPPSRSRPRRRSTACRASATSSRRPRARAGCGSGRAAIVQRNRERAEMGVRDEQGVPRGSRRWRGPKFTFPPTEVDYARGRAACAGRKVVVLGDTATRAHRAARAGRRPRRARGGPRTRRTTTPPRATRACGGSRARHRRRRWRASSRANATRGGWRSRTSRRATTATRAPSVAS